MIGVANIVSAAMLAGTLHAPAQPAWPAVAQLSLSVHQGQSPGGESIGAATLTCHPGGGSHPSPAAACAALDRAGGQPELVTGRNGVCPMIYNPVTAVAYGHWGPRPVRFEKTYSNSCVLKDELTPVYDF